LLQFTLYNLIDASASIIFQEIATNLLETYISASETLRQI